MIETKFEVSTHFWQSHFSLLEISEYYDYLRDHIIKEKPHTPRFPSRPQRARLTQQLNVLQIDVDAIDVSAIEQKTPLLSSTYKPLSRSLLT